MKFTSCRYFFKLIRGLSGAESSITHTSKEFQKAFQVVIYLYQFVSLYKGRNHYCIEYFFNEIESCLKKNGRLSVLNFAFQILMWATVSFEREGSFQEKLIIEIVTVNSTHVVFT